MISKENLRDLYPLTPMQEGMLFHALIDGGARAYHEQVMYDLSGPLEPALFERAWQAVVDRHDVLRTVFMHEKAERPLQAVLKAATIPFAYRDLRHLPEADRKVAVDAYVADDRTRGFDLKREVALRIAVLRIEDARHVVVWSFHHILLDGWSTGLLVAELALTYDALRHGTTPVLPPPIPFSRFVNWLGQRDANAAREYWRSMLAGYESRVEIPGAANRAHGDAYEHCELVVEMDDPYDKLQAVAARLGVTPYSLFQTAWSVMLGRANQTGDVLFGSIVSGRPPILPGIEQMIGLLINVLPVRVTFKEDETLETIARRIQQASLDAIEHGFLPLSETPAGTLMTHLMAFETYPLEIKPATDAPDALRLEGVRSFERTNYDLALVITPAKRLRLAFLFNRLTFSEETISALAANLQVILRAIIEDAGRTVADTPIQTEGEWRRQLGFADTARTYPSDRVIHEVFDETFEPDAIAIVADSLCMTYAELNRRANQLAHRLRASGVGPESLVAVANIRSPETVVAVLAVLKAGGAYLGLEPDWPEDRVRYILDDAGVDTVLSKAPCPPAFAASGKNVIALDLREPWSGPETSPVVPMTSRNMAYICYTSGSTGKPKGVAVEHRSVMRLIRDTDYAEFPPGDRMLLFSLLAFDVSTYEMWGALLNRGTLVIVTYPQPSLEELGTLIKEQALDTVWLSSGLFAAMVDERLADLSNVRQLLTGGDVVSPPHARKVLEAYPHLVLINGYGPTENTTFTSCHRMLTTADVGNPVPIGRAVPNTRVYVLDKHLRPLAIGANGELYAAGDGLARDYRNRPSLTASRFIPDPLALQPGERMYTVGDTVRFRRDGTLEFFGRLDDQAKVRGFRVEAGELEAVLNAQRSVRGCVAIIQRDPETKEASLVAYVVPEDASQFDEAAMLAMLEATVPAFLVPSAIIPLPVIPLTANGKLDRRRLPAAGAKRVEAQADRVHVEPNTDAQHKIAAIWREVLNVERVSVQDDFFELGGHSLSALRVVSRMRKVFGVEVPLPDIFTAPTIALLAAAIETREGHAPSARPLVRRERVAVTLDAPSE